ncbi:MAG: esterase-like activity of phytase family protein [Acidimicrobiales bacterium]
MAIKRFQSRCAAVAVGALAVIAAGSGLAAADQTVTEANLPDRSLSTFQRNIVNARNIRLGGIGSGIFHSGNNSSNEFWMLTDRGPNGQPGGLRTFPVPEFVPSIVKVKVKDERVEVVERIPLRTWGGAPISGLPNLATVTSPLSATPPAADEVPYAFDGVTPLNTYDLNGLDTEDIVRLKNGEFWVVDEYRPSVLRIAANGRVLARYVPKGMAAQMAGAGYPVIDSLPAEYAYRRVNRGFEGLAVSPEGDALFVALQSPLQLPPSVNVGRDSRNTRILRMNLKGEVTGEFLYRFEEFATFDPILSPPNRARDMKLSGLYALNSSQVLVLERTDFVAKVYLVDLASATNLRAWTPPAGSALNVLESLGADAALAGAGVTPLPKRLIVDLDAIPGMPDKIEGITLTKADELVVVNDNDFGLRDETIFDAAGNLANDTGLASKVITIKLPERLPLSRGQRGD